MQGFFEFPNESTYYPSLCEVAKGKFLPFIEKEEANEISVSCNNVVGQNIITCKHPYHQDFITEVEGLDFNVRLKSVVKDLPFYIPILDIGSSKYNLPSSLFPVIGLTLSDIISHGAKEIAGQYHEQYPFQFRTKVLTNNCFDTKQVILFLTGIDTLIEFAWWGRTEYKLFEQINTMGFAAVGGINFSVIGGECAFAQVLNQKRSLYSAFLIEKAGTPTIPHVYALTSYHRQRWIKWFLANPEIQVFTINCQLQKTEQDIRELIITITEILNAIPALHVLLQGFRLNNLMFFGPLLSRIHIADKMPVKYSHMKKELKINKVTGNLYYTTNSNQEKGMLLLNNIITRNLYYEKLKQSILSFSTTKK